MCKLIITVVIILLKDVAELVWQVFSRMACLQAIQLNQYVQLFLSS